MNKYDEYMKDFNFNAAVMKEQVVEWIRAKMEGFGPDSKVVIGISGGKDSTVVAALCVEALGANRVIGVMMPNGVQHDIEDSVQVVMHLGIKHYVINVQDGCNGIIDEVMAALNRPASEAALTNFPARVRMTTLYAVAQTLGKAFVVNTCNLSEDWIGYSTWHGDSAGDFSPLADLTTDEVVAIGDACGLPHNLTHKTPSDGLCGKTDEDNIGYSYYTLNRYIRTGEIDDPALKDKIDHRHKANLFKLEPLDKFHYAPNI